MDRNNKEQAVIEIEDDVIDLDESEKTPEEEIYEWDAKIRKTFFAFSLNDNENLFDKLMKEYLQSLEDICRLHEDNESLRKKILCHLRFLHSYFMQMHCCHSENYLRCMEDIVTIYCNVEIEVLKTSKGRQHKRFVAKRIIYAISVFLLYKQEHMMHVLMKMKQIDNQSTACTNTANIIYRHFTTDVVVPNSSDESFCRTYIVFQKWKRFCPKETWNDMDSFMYKMSKRTPEDVKNNEILKRILMPANDDPADIVLALFRSYSDLARSYFNYLNERKLVENDDLDLELNIDLGDDDDNLFLINNMEDEEEIKFSESCREFEKFISGLPQTGFDELPEMEAHIKEEFEDDDVMFVGVSLLEPPPPISIPDISSPEPILPLLPSPVSISTEKLVNDTNSQPLNGLIKTTPVAAIPTVSDTSSTTIAIPLVETVIESSALTTATDEVIPQNIAISTPTTETTKQTVETQETIPNSPISISENVIEEPPTTANIPITSTETIPTVSISSVETVVEAPASITIQQPPEVPQIDNNQSDINKSAQTSYVYNDFGLTTPPFDVTNDETHNNCVYTEKVINQNVDVYNDYGLTPPTDVPIEESRTNNCVYTDITEKNPNNKQSEQSSDLVNNCECNNIETDLDHVEIEVETTNVVNENDNNVEQIDTGQKITAAPASEFPVNGVVKPLLVSNRTSPQPKVMFSLTKKITASLDKFSKFENEWKQYKENKEFDDILSGPVGKLIPQQQQQQSPNRSESPGDISSPLYETVREDEFRDFYSDSVNNGRLNIQPLKGILKKPKDTAATTTTVTIRRNSSLMASAAVHVPRSVRLDSKLNMKPKVILERLSMIEKEMKKVLNNPPTLRVDYDKSTSYISERDVLRCVSPPRISMTLKTFELQRNNKTGSSLMMPINRSDEKPTKRKRALTVRIQEPPVTKRRRVFRPPPKKAEVKSNNNKKGGGAEVVVEPQSQPQQQKVEKKRKGRRRNSRDSPPPPPTTNNLLSNSDSEFDKLLKSDGYTHQPFRLDLPSS